MKKDTFYRILGIFLLAVILLVAIMIYFKKKM
jgi:hypothetical protein